MTRAYYGRRSEYHSRVQAVQSSYNHCPCREKHEPSSEVLRVLVAPGIHSDLFFTNLYDKCYGGGGNCLESNVFVYLWCERQAPDQPETAPCSESAHVT